jgi:hypothetical protein
MIYYFCLQHGGLLIPHFINSELQVTEFLNLFLLIDVANIAGLAWREVSIMAVENCFKKLLEKMTSKKTA